MTQWQSKYMSLVNPNAMPRMVSGPDYFPEERWRRLFEDAAKVTPMEFTRGFARRVEAAARNDWMAVPIIRNVNFRFRAEQSPLIFGPLLPPALELEPQRT